MLLSLKSLGMALALRLTHQGNQTSQSDHLLGLHPAIEFFSADLAEHQGGFTQAELVVVGVLGDGAGPVVAIAGVRAVTSIRL